MDTNYSHIEARAQAFEEEGQPCSRIHHELGNPDKDGRGRVSMLYSEYYGEVQGRERPLPGAKELTASLFERGYGVWLPVPSPRSVRATYDDRPESPNPIDP
jgi:hypothetical protein